MSRYGVEYAGVPLRRDTKVDHQPSVSRKVGLHGLIIPQTSK